MREGKKQSALHHRPPSHFTPAGTLLRRCERELVHSSESLKRCQRGEREAGRGTESKKRGEGGEKDTTDKKNDGEKRRWQTDDAVPLAKTRSQDAGIRLLTKHGLLPQTHTHTPDTLIAGQGKNLGTYATLPILNWTMASFLYRLSSASICTPPPILLHHFLHLPHGRIYTFMTARHEPVCVESPCCRISGLNPPAKLSVSEGRAGSSSRARISRPEKRFIPNWGRGQSQAWRERETALYHVSTRCEAEDYLPICSQTGGAGWRERRERGEWWGR